MISALLLVAGTGAFQGSVRWWCRDHRVHHRYVDTDKDPYNAKEGFFYSHIGWMLLKQHPEKLGQANIADLNADPLIRWQHRNYLWFAPLVSFVLPSLICGLGWGDYRGGFFVAGIARLVFVHHATFCINSLAHTIGAASFDDEMTARDHWITALFTMGEGFHNFHHLFSNDYRNGIRMMDYDPTKWIIQGLSMLGLAWDLKMTSPNEIAKARFSVEKRRLDKLHRTIDWGVPLEELPFLSLSQIQQRNKEGDMLLIIDNVVYDVSEFLGEHPGGPEMLQSYVGKDATGAFTGDVHKHSHAALNRLLALRAGRFKR
jgi:stearoyl-CoA desaturase (delta-9 desaturase)